MRSVNKVILIGNLTRDPELRQTPNGQAVATFGLATNREWITRDGRKMNSAEFHECVVWARLAEISAQYLKKGKLVYVEGYLKTRSWDTPEGVKKFRTEIIVHDMIMLDKRAKGDSGSDYVPQDEETYASGGGPREDGGEYESGRTHKGNEPYDGNGQQKSADRDGEFTPLAPLDESDPQPHEPDERPKEKRKPSPGIEPRSISIEGDLGI